MPKDLPKDMDEKDNKIVQENQVVAKQELVDFEKAFRIFKRDNLKAQKWDAQAVLLFCKKRNSNKVNTQEVWADLFNKY